MRGGSFRSADEIRYARKVAAWLKKLRKKFLIGQLDLGLLADGASRNAVSSWERAKSTPSAYQLHLLQKYAKEQSTEAPSRRGKVAGR